MNSQKQHRCFRVETLEPLVLLSASSIEPDVAEQEPDTASIESASPVAIDLNDDGKIGVTGQTTAKNKSDITQIGETIAFDIDGDGDLEQIEWFDGSGDGILIDTANLDADNVTGADLFGDEGGRYENGYEKLKAFDLNGNKLIDKEEFADLKLWVDDGDGRIESGELQELSDHNIFSINLRVNHGHGLIRSWAYTETDGRLMTEDVWFAIDENAEPSQQEEPNQPPVAVDDVAAVMSGESVIIDILGNDFDSDRDPLSVIDHTRAEHGRIELNRDNTMTYAAPENFVGVVYVQYTISDGEDLSIATVRIDVMPRPTAKNIVPVPQVADTKPALPDPVAAGYWVDDADDDASEKSGSGKSGKSGSNKSGSGKSDKSGSSKSDKSGSSKSDKSGSSKSDKSGSSNKSKAKKKRKRK